MKATELDVVTLVNLNAPALTGLLLQRIAAAGYPGVKPSHGYVIQRLVEDEPTIGTLAESLGMTQQGASKQVSDLERLGWVERVSDEDDHRVRYVRLTATGRGVLAAGRRVQAEIERELVAQCGQRNVNAARNVLAALLRVTGLEPYVGSRTVPMPRG